MKWFPERMTEVEIEVPDRYARKVTELLADQGVIQMEDISYLSVSSASSGSSQRIDWQEKTSEFTNLEKQLLDTMRTLEIDPGAPEEKQMKMLSETEELHPFVDQMEREVQESSRIVNEAQKKIDQLQKYIDLLSPLTVLDIPINRIRNRRYMYSILGNMPTDKIERFKTSMTNIPFTLLVLKEDEEKAIVLLLGSIRNKDYLQRAARSAYLSEVDIPEKYQGKPAEVIAELNEEINGLKQELGTISQGVDEIRKNRATRLRDSYWRVRYSRMMAEALTRYARLGHGYLIAGWLPAENVLRLSDSLKEISPEILVDIKDQDEESDNQHAPVILEKKKFQAGFQKLVTTYGMPAFNELDPTSLLTITFPLLFGAMFGDVGHGLILALVGLLMISGKIKQLSRFNKLGTVVLLCGLAAMVFGFVYGSVFGFEEVLTPLWQHPIDNIMSLLIVAFGFGVILLSLANILSFINDIHQRRWVHLIFSNKGIAGLILFWSLLGLVVSMLVKGFPIPTLVFVLGIILAVVLIFLYGMVDRIVKKEKPYFEGGVFLYVILVFFELFESILGYLSNSLSYVRIGAFAVAHAGLTSVFFILAELVSPEKGFGYWVVLVIGNLFVIGFEGMIVSIQTLRLEYYEFFSKFFSGSGRRFNPFRLGTTNSQGVK